MKHLYLYLFNRRNFLINNELPAYSTASPTTKYLTKILFLSLCAFICVWMTGCGSTLPLDSKWSGNNIVIDGKQEEWGDNVNYIEDKNIALGFANDDQFLYISLSGIRRDLQRQILTMGLIFWFDPDGGKEKTFGIKFPVGRIGQRGLPQQRQGWGEESEEERLSRQKKALEDIEIFTDGDDEPFRMRVGEAMGIAAKVSGLPESMTCELKIPLSEGAGFPYAINVTPGSTLGVGLETGKLDRNSMQGLRAGGGIGGRSGGGGMRGGRGGGRGPAGGGARPQLESQFKLWMAISLDSNAENAALLEN